MLSSIVSTALLSLCAASPIVASPIAKRDDNAYAFGQSDVAIDAPGVPYSPAYKGFPTGGWGPAQNNFVSALALNFLNPGWVPEGVNPSSCTPKEGQYPVILIPGTTETVFANWAYLGPRLAQEEGLCVYSFAHSPMQLFNPNNDIKGTAFMGDIPTSAQALSAFIDEVLAMTGAEKVDMVGHSQGGGAQPYYYLKNIMEGSKVRKHIGLAPSLGTNFWGIEQLVNFVLPGEILDQTNNILNDALNIGSLYQQLESSSFMTALHEGGLTVEGVEYVNLATKYDDVLLPYTNCIVNEENRNITNIILQDVCGIDYSDHLGLSYSPVVYQIVKNHLFDTNNTVECTLQLPVITR